MIQLFDTGKPMLSVQLWLFNCESVHSLLNSSTTSCLAVTVWHPHRTTRDPLSVYWLTCPNCYNIMNPHGLCNLPLLYNSVFHDTTSNLARVHFKSQHRKSGIYCLLVSIILHHCLHFVGI